MKQTRLVFLFLMFLSSFGFAQFGDQMKNAPLAQDKFTSMAGFPRCLTLAPANGDPSKGAYVVVLKATAGCIAPWHWHSGDENAMFVSGRGKLESKDGAPQTVNAGDYAYMPAKHPHQLTCSTPCTLFLSSPQPFDLHYVDQSGNEIPPEQALKSSGAKPATKAGMKKPAMSGAKPPSQ